MANIITLTGASHCGKSSVRNSFLLLRDNNFNPILFKKFTTRKARTNDDDVECVAKIPDDCDFVYEQYGVRYGFSFNKLFEHLKRGETPIIVVNDIRAVEDLKTAVGSQVQSLFIYRRPPQLIAFVDQELSRIKDKGEKNQVEAKKTAERRSEKAVAIHRIYIENIHLFDNVILNINGAQDKTEEQIKRIVKKLTKSIEGLD
jgi:guanylate kinase